MNRSGLAMPEVNARRKLRVGVLVDALTVPAWAGALLREIARSDCAEIALVVVNAATHARRSVLGKLWRHRHLLLYLGYTAIDRKLFPVAPDAFEPTDAGSLLAGVPQLSVMPVEKKFSDVFPKEAVGAIRGANLDVIVRLGFRILRGDILTAARCGVWSYHHGDGERYRGGPPGFWEVMESNPVTGSMLQILTEDLDNGLVLASSHAGTDPTSVRRNTNGYFWKTAALIPRKLAELHRLGSDEFLRRVRAANETPKGYSHPLYRPPTNAQFIGPLLRHCARAVTRKMSNLVFRDRWELRYRHGDGVQTSMRQFKTLPMSRGRFWADPHLVRHDGRDYLFFEEYPFRTRKGHISVVVLDEKGNPGRAEIVLERPYHLSYPHVFRVGDDHYMTPETIGNRTVELYKCREFPNKWELCATLMRDVDAVDPTPFFRDGRWWLFVSMAAVLGASPWDELFLFHAPELTSNRWEPHPLNPIVSDVRRARPAGRLFEYRGHLYRPSQDCSKRYGYGLRLNRVTELTPDSYAEEEVAFLEPLWERGLRGIHSISWSENLTVVDVERKRFRWFA
jgi:hypothetical protein